MRAGAEKTLAKAQTRRTQRHKTHSDAMFKQLMEAHMNSEHKGAAGGQRSLEGITIKNFGARTGLNWPEQRVAREIAGLVGGFTTGQEAKIRLVHNKGRAVAETMSSMVEFDGSGDPQLYPFKSKQQIAAKLLEMFSDGDMKFTQKRKHQSIATPRMAVWTERKGGQPSSKVYLYQDGGGPVTLETAAAGASAVPTPGNNSGVVSSGSSPFPEAGQHGMLHHASSHPTPARAAASSTSSSTVDGTTQQAEPPTDGRTPGGGRGGRVDGIGDHSMGVVVQSTSSGRSVGEDDGDIGVERMGGECNPICAGDDSVGIDAAGFPCHPGCLSGFSATTLQPLSSGHPSMAPPVARYISQQQPASSDSILDEPPWDNLTGCFVSLWASASGPSAQHKSGFGGTNPSALRSHGTFLPLSSPARGASSHFFQPNGHDRKSLRISPIPIIGAPLRPTFGDDTSIATSAESSAAQPGCVFHQCRDRRDDRRSAVASDKTVVPCDAVAVTAGAVSPADDGPRQAMSFPSSVSYAEQTSLRLAFGSALTQESWLLGTSESCDVEMIFDASPSVNEDQSRGRRL